VDRPTDKTPVGRGFAGVLAVTYLAEEPAVTPSRSTA
jgi:hypothetical protein